ncbi:PREDICTED: uncharacterized protein LOC109234846 [Nicotiana attenuata]|uniref:uncharacterized protein LOC109234846 n=1 Tax=Nicotiana attenuata TaxID=49451 RepID=UPI0009053CA6|nr:PREDICTED: uncharacterized protein LOC109234846 [Nicotiana attenuata]
MVVLAVYVDDIILTGNDVSAISDLKSYLDEQFKIKDLGILHYFLGIEVSPTPDGLLLNQRKFILDLLAEYKCYEVSPVVSPLDLTLKLQAADGELLPNPELYRSLVGKFNFLTHTRPDLSFAVQHLSQFLQSPRVPHYSAALHVLRFLKGTSDYGIFFNNSSDFALHGYCDSDWAACPDSRKSVTGFFVLFGGIPVSWKSKKQPVVSLSSAEAEYRALSKLVAEITWMTRLLEDLGVAGMTPVSVFCDNQSALHIARNPVFHERTKHIEVDCHFVRGKLSEGLITLFPVSSTSQLANILTKPLTGLAHHGFLPKLKILPSLTSN